MLPGRNWESPPRCTSIPPAATVSVREKSVCLPAPGPIAFATGSASKVFSSAPNLRFQLHFVLASLFLSHDRQNDVRRHRRRAINALRGGREVGSDSFVDAGHKFLRIAVNQRK